MATLVRKNPSEPFRAEVECDGCGDNTRARYRQHEKDAIRSARFTAANEDWFLSETRDLCRICKKRES